VRKQRIVASNLKLDYIIFITYVQKDTQADIFEPIAALTAKLRHKRRFAGLAQDLNLTGHDRKLGTIRCFSVRLALN